LKGKHPSQTRIGRSLGGSAGSRSNKQNKKKSERNVKTTLKTIVYVQMAALYISGVLASAVAAEPETPFRGSLEAAETHEVQFPTLFVEGSGTGNATQLGAFAVTYHAEVNLVTRVGAGSVVFSLKRTRKSGSQKLSLFLLSRQAKGFSRLPGACAPREKRNNCVSLFAGFWLMTV
jgi:hypothetical protein